MDLFAGICVREFSTARAWYEQLLGREPSFLPHATEAVWELAEHRSIAVVENPRRAGYAHTTVFVEDFDGWVGAIAERGIEPAERETYSNGVRKAIYRDPDGNELGVGGPPVGAG